MYPETVSRLIDAAIARLIDSMGQGESYVVRQAAHWINGLAGTDDPADYFKHPLAFPMLLLPWWMERTLRSKPDSEPDVDFQADLIYSSISGYYFIRMIDNVMDGHGTVEQKLLPMLGLFHTQFQGVYYAYFPHGHPFWQTFHAICAQSAESSLRDGALDCIDLEEFTTVAGKKVVGGKIPLAAVCYRYDRTQLYECWQKFYDKLGCWHQMYNDIFGWMKDLRHQTPTYFLSEGERRKRPDQTVVAWVIQEGFGWGIATLEAWLDELHRLAETLESRELVEYLVYRQRLMREQSERISRAFSRLDRLMGA